METCVRFRKGQNRSFSQLQLQPNWISGHRSVNHDNNNVAHAAILYLRSSNILQKDLLTVILRLHHIHGDLDAATMRYFCSQVPSTVGIDSRNLIEINTTE